MFVFPSCLTVSAQTLREFTFQIFRKYISINIEGVNQFVPLSIHPTQKIGNSTRYKRFYQVEKNGEEFHRGSINREKGREQCTESRFNDQALSLSYYYY